MISIIAENVTMIHMLHVAQIILKAAKAQSNYRKWHVAVCSVRTNDRNYFYKK